MSRNHNDTPAFPVLTEASTYFGLTKREYFAALALNGLLAYKGSYGEYGDIAKHAFLAADAMVNESNNKL